MAAEIDADANALMPVMLYTYHYEIQFLPRSFAFIEIGCIISRGRVTFL